MAIIVTALHCEAAPLIEFWGLRRAVHHRAFQLFRGDSNDAPVELIVSGIGKVRSAVAATVLAAPSTLDAPIIVNLGICGAAQHRTIGDLVYAHRIVDHASGQAWHPDPVLKHSFYEGVLTTFDHPVTPETAPAGELDLVDMEGSGFAEAASIYTSPSAWASLKVVSDHFSPERVSKERVGELIGSRVGPIDEFVRSLSEAHRADKFRFDPSDEGVLNRFLTTYRLTASQKRLMTTAAREFILRTGGDLGILNRFLHREPNSKAELREIFNEAHRALTTP